MRRWATRILTSLALLSACDAGGAPQADTAGPAVAAEPTTTPSITAVHNAPPPTEQQVGRYLQLLRNAADDQRYDDLRRKVLSYRLDTGLDAGDALTESARTRRRMGLLDYTSAAMGKLAQRPGEFEPVPPADVPGLLSKHAPAEDGAALLASVDGRLLRFTEGEVVVLLTYDADKPSLVAWHNLAGLAPDVVEEPPKAPENLPMLPARTDEPATEAPSSDRAAPPREEAATTGGTAVGAPSTTKPNSPWASGTPHFMGRNPNRAPRESQRVGAYGSDAPQIVSGEHPPKARATSGSVTRPSNVSPSTPTTRPGYSPY